MTERINEINELINKHFKRKEEVLENLSKFQLESFQIDKDIEKLNDEKKKIEEEIEKTKINTFDNFIKEQKKGLDYKKNDLVFFGGKIYLVLKNHLAEKPPTEDLTNYLEIERKEAR